MRGGEAAVTKDLAGRGQRAVERGRVVARQPGELVLERERGVLQDAQFERIRLYFSSRRRGRGRRSDLGSEAIALQKLLVDLDLLLAAEPLRACDARQGDRDKDRGRHQGLFHTAPILSDFNERASSCK